MARLTRFIHPYYVANMALVLSWLVFRFTLNIDKLQNKFYGTFVTGEAALFISMTIYLYKKFKRCNTWDSFITKSFAFYQALVVFMLWYVSVTVMAWYAVACLASYFIFRLPSGGESPNVVELDDISFEQHISSKVKSKQRPDDVAWLVFFTANWHNECTFYSHVFADMADKYGVTEKIKFGRLDDRHKAIFDANQVCVRVRVRACLPARQVRVRVCVSACLRASACCRVRVREFSAGILPLYIGLHCGCVRDPK